MCRFFLPIVRVSAFIFFPSFTMTTDNKVSFIAPKSVELVDNAVVVQGTNSTTGNPYTSTYELTKTGIKNRKTIEKFLSPSTFFGKG